MKYLISFALPRFCDQSLDRSRKERFYPAAASRGWPSSTRSSTSCITSIPSSKGIRRIERGDGTYSAQLPQPALLRAGRRDGARRISTRGPIRRSYDFLRHDFETLERGIGGVVGTSFRTFPSYPQRFIERLAHAAGRARSDMRWRRRRAAAPAAAARRATPRTICTSASFLRDTSRRLVRKGQFRAA